MGRKQIGPRLTSDEKRVFEALEKLLNANGRRVWSAGHTVAELMRVYVGQTLLGLRKSTEPASYIGSALGWASPAEHQEALEELREAYVKWQEGVGDSA